MTGNDRKRTQLWKIWIRQKGKCFYCDRETVIRYRNGGGPARDEDATLEHLDDRFSDDRGKRGGEYRRVMACSPCNHEMGRQRQMQQPIEELHERSQRHPSKQRNEDHAH